MVFQNRLPLPASALIAAMMLAGCQSAYYSTLERFGIEKRDVLVDRVEAAQDSQQDAQEEFRSALDQFRSVVNFDGGELEESYNRLSDAYEDATDQAEDVRERIDSVDEVGRALFTEWEQELDQYQSLDLRRQSETRLGETQRQFDTLLAAMNRAADRMDPVLEVFQDQVLNLKHNLNARAIASLEVERANLEERVENLIVEMEKAIQEADSFLQTMA